MRFGLIFVLVIPAVGFAAPGTGPAMRPVRWNRPAILRSVEAARRRVTTLDVHFSAVPVRAGSEHAAYAAHVVVRRDANNVTEIFIDRRSTGPSGKPFHQPIAFNGQFTCWYQEFNGMGGIMPGLIENAALRREAFFQMNLLAEERRPPPPPDVRRDASLVEFLRNSFTTVGPRLEEIDGDPCCVLTNGGWFHANGTVWLDPERGFLPLQQKYAGDRERGGAAGGETLWKVTRSEEVNGEWFATEGVETLPDGAEIRVAVARNKDGSPEVVVNRPLAADFFDLWKTLPRGTRLFNKAANVTYVVGPRGELTAFSPGQKTAGQPVSPDLEESPARVWASGWFTVLVVGPVLFLVCSLVAMLVGSWRMLPREREGT